MDADLGQQETKHFASLPLLTDWRGVVCRFLNLPSQAEELEILDALHTATETIRAAKDVRVASATTVVGGVGGSDDGPEYQTIHRIRCHSQHLGRDQGTKLYRDEPVPIHSDGRSVHLHGGRLIGNLELHLERHKSVAFLVYKDYDCCIIEDPALLYGSPAADADLGDASTMLANESVSIVSEALSDAMTKLGNEAKNSMPLPNFGRFEEFSSPYLWWYCQRDRLLAVAATFEPELLQHVMLFHEYILATLGDTYTEVDRLLKDGKIMPEYLPYLYIPGEVQFSKLDGDKAKFHRAFQATSWYQDPGRSPSAKTDSGDAFILGKYWSYDGSFQQHTKEWPLTCDYPEGEEFDIRTLDVYPIKFAEATEVDALRRRGSMFWECRWPKYVCCPGDGGLHVQNSSDARFMIDIHIYKEMHPPSGTLTNTDDLGPFAMKPGQPPPGDDAFLLCLPATLPGYHMHKKDWVTLPVSQIAEVKWNDNAFQKLVIDEQKKELIRALVTNRLKAEESTDLMSGKGNGLFILLHGGPGTGKTLTAESLSEIARKPLYRVTCGDIGTKAEDVERYLETVMLLGKAWGCVVLLDEADVFLMHRSVENFERNALVSVFLRILEYYDGILILTSNRVGTFDEAFKSRIQLSLHYPPLGEGDRRRIWTNFLEHVEGLTASRTAQLGIRSDEIKSRLADLARTELNGREIRNAVSTARQLAMFKQEPMGYRHLETVISEMKKFDAYATDLRDGLTAEEAARGTKVR